MTTPSLPQYMLTYPTVFAVGDQYQIFMPFSDEVIVWVKVGEHTYYDHCNGVLRSRTNMHRVTLPMSVLDEAKEYTVVYRKMIDRSPYFPKSEDERTLTLPFKPVKAEGKINLYHVSDAHNLVAEPIACGQYFGDELDLLVLNGDIPNHSGDVRNFNAICEIASGITFGQIPCVFARGNHDTRGIHAEDMPDYIPIKDGKTYYTFRAGCVWGLLMDCGEDKPDSCAEYGYTICFHDFRLEETEFLKSVIANADNEYNAPGVKYRLIISHIGFTHVQPHPFDIEQELYREWTQLTHQMHPDLMLYGHHHTVKICPPGCDFDDWGQPCTAIIGSKPIFSPEGNGFVGCGVTLRADGTKRVVFNDHKGNVLTDEVVK
ncbi:MAG: metallophosphoesterase [Clostridia bacterium]|nr:metallophosphoesterase [Clostridia bacterium]MBQ5793730.1 metallophosphoesterase [Clostridia bacterium]